LARGVFFDAEGTAVDGQPYTNTYACFLEMQQGRIVRLSRSSTASRSTPCGNQ
jgi:ketosteroid isomerase-like protein